jgi:transcriptional regulator with XRE-family HTH domain
MFSKKDFKELLFAAIGDRSLTDFAKASGVNRTYISKYVNEKLENPPSPEIIKRIADKAQNGVTYKDLMAVAGYIPNELIESKMIKDFELLKRLFPYLPPDLKHQFTDDQIEELFNNKYKEKIKEELKSTPFNEKQYLYDDIEFDEKSEPQIETKAFHTNYKDGLPDEAIKQIDDYIEFIKQKYNPDGSLKKTE